MKVRTAQSLENALQTPEATYLSGATDFMPLLKNRVRDDVDVVLVGKLPELKGIAEEDGFLRIGAGESLTDIAEDEKVRMCFPALSQAAGQTASPQIRNIATLGGNILQDRRCIYFNQSELWRSNLTGCFKTGGDVCQQIPNSPVCRAIYYSDTATALIVYDAEVVYFEKGEEKRSTVEELVHRHCGANGLSCRHRLPVLIREFLLKKPSAEEKSGFYKYTIRASIDFPLVNYALRFGGDRAPKLVAGAVSVEPVLLPETAALLDDSSVNNDAIIVACRAELAKKAKLIKEDLISPARKKDMFALVSFLLQEVRPE